VSFNIEYFGVIYKDGTNYKKRYQACIRFNEKVKYIGIYASAYEAAEHWDLCARNIVLQQGKRKYNFSLTKDLSHIILPKWLQ
jgi:hypothetical protein